MLATFGECCELMATFGESWQLLANVVNFWQMLSTFGKCWHLLATCGKCWQPYMIFVILPPQTMFFGQFLLHTKVRKTIFFDHHRQNMPLIVHSGHVTFKFLKKYH